MTNRLKLLLTLALLVSPVAACIRYDSTAKTAPPKTPQQAANSSGPARNHRTPAPYGGKIIHVLVALCDNVNQGIVPVPAALVNGEDPERNLYWGARFGVKTFFKRDRNWRLLETVGNPAPPILERLVFKHTSRDAYLIADAYRGAEIKRATTDFLDAAAGVSRATASVEGRHLGLSRGASAHMVAYVGHDGLMDFSLDSFPARQDDTPRDAVILACASRSYFRDALRRTGANPLLWTNGLMAPEAYVLKAAVDGWLAGESGETVRLNAAREYHAYQKCGLNAARRLFANGW
ncbi:MAG TPA: hypothetical protein VNA19_12395 [Pyrinomonadaceae bacterium]|jgi:hypothetical protein|nr:hypothetical protein [Pyrinomonadaceae bacterium]